MFKAGLHFGIAGWCGMVADLPILMFGCWAIGLLCWTLPTLLETYVALGGTFGSKE